MNYFSQDDILDIISDLLILVSPEGNIVKINNAVLKLTNFSEDDLIKKNIKILFKDKNESFLNKYKTNKNTSNIRTFNEELLLKKKNGETITTSASINVVQNNNGDLKGYIFLCRDLTERIKNENELRQYKNNLEELVNEQTKNLIATNQKLKDEISERENIEIDLKKKNKEINLINEKLNDTLKDLTASNEEYEAQNKELISSHDELIASEEKFRQMIELAPYPIIILENNKLIFSNKKSEDTFGYTLDEIVDLETWLNLAYPDKNYREYVLKIWMESVAKSIENEIHMEPLEFEVTSKTGDKKTIEFQTIIIDNMFYVRMNDLTDIRINYCRIRTRYRM